MAEWWQEGSTPVEIETSSQEDNIQESIVDANVGKLDKEEDDEWWKTGSTEVSDPSKLDYGLGELAGKSIKRSFVRLGSTFGDVIPAIGLSTLGFDEAARAQMEEYAATEEMIERNYPAQYKTLDDVNWKNPIDISKFAVETLGDNSANLVAVLIPGIGAAKTGASAAASAAKKTLAYETAAALVNKKASDIAKDKIVKAATTKGANIGQVGGVFLGSYALNTPEVFKNIYEQTGNFEVMASVLAGGVNASLDSIFPITLMRSFSTPARASIISTILQKSGMNKSLANSATTKILGSAAVEGLTETAQESVGITAENFVQDHSLTFDSKDYDRLLEGGVRGFVAGGGFRGIGEGSKKVTNKLRKDAAIQNAKNIKDALAAEAAAKAKAANQLGSKEVTEAEAIAEAEAVARVSNKAEKERLQQEVNEKLLTEEGINNVLDNMPKYFSGYQGAELNKIRNDLRKARAGLKKQPSEQGPLLLEDLSNRVIEKVKPERDLEQDILNYIEKTGKTNPSVIQKELKVGKGKTKVILGKLMAEFKIKGQKVGSKQEYTSLNYVPPTPKKTNYAGVPKAKKGDKPFKITSTGKFTESVASGLSHILELSGIEFVYPFIKPENMDARLQKKIINELDKYITDVYENQYKGEERADGTIYNREDARENVKNQIEDITNIEELTQAGLSRQSIDALKEYSQEVKDDTQKTGEGTVSGPESTGGGSATLVDGGPKDAERTSTLVRDAVADSESTSRGATSTTGGVNPALELKKGDEAKTISENEVRPLDFKVKLKPQETMPSSIVLSDSILESEVTDAQVEKGLSSLSELNRQAAGINVKTAEQVALEKKHDVNDETQDSTLLNGHAAPLSMNGPHYVTRKFNVVSDYISGLPVAQSGLGETLSTIFSNIPDNIARIYAGFLNIPQQFELAGNRLPALKKLREFLELKASVNKDGFEEISYVVQYVQEITDKYKETPQGQVIIKEWNDVLLTLSGRDIDPEVMLNNPNGEHVPSRRLIKKRGGELETLVGKKIAKALSKKEAVTIRNLPPEYILSNGKIYETKTNREFLETNPDIAALVRRYEKLPQDLKDAAQRMIINLREKYNLLLEESIKRNPENAIDLRKQFVMKPYYFPFIRKGDYWISYTDTETGRIGYIATTSASIRRKKMKEIEESGVGTDPKISIRPKEASLGTISGAAETFIEGVKSSLNNLKLPDVTEEAMPKVRAALIADMESNYLQLFPAQSLKQNQQHREAVPGYIEDVLLAYSSAAPKITSSIANTRYNREIIAQVNAVQMQAAKNENKNDKFIQGIAASNLDRVSFFLNPAAKNYAAFAAYGSYYWFLGLNPSSALINTTQLPLVVYPFLSTEYTQGSALKALNDARKLYFGGKGMTGFQSESAKGFLNDLTMAPFEVDFKTGEKTYTGANAKLFKPGGLYHELFRIAEQSQTIRRGISYEATELSRQTGAAFDKPNRIGAKIDAAVGYLFQNSERFNREVTIVAAYNLEMEKLEGSNWRSKDRTTIKYKKNEKRAIEKGIDLTIRAHSHALPEVGPEFFQDGILKVMTIFKRFAQQQIYLSSKLFLQMFPRNVDYSGMTKEEKLDVQAERKLAIKRTIGLMGMSFALAGVQGMPFYGMGYLLYELIADDEDEPKNLDTFLAQEMGNTMFRGPVNKILGIDMSRRTGFRDMIFQSDPQRLEKLGFMLYAIETAAGPAYSAGKRVQEGLTETFDQGFNLRSSQKMLPTALGNTLKAVRQATEGVRNRRGISIADDPNLYQTFMQVMGFTSLEISEAYARANAIKGPERRLYQRRSRLLLEYWLAMRSGDNSGLKSTREEIAEFNSKAPPSFKISPKTIQRSIKNRRKIEMRAIDGVDVKNRRELELIYGID